jgi:hypothetical protein
MLNHFSVSNIRAISNDPNDIGYSYQVAVVISNTDGSNKTSVYKIKNTEEITKKLNEIADLITSYTPAVDSLEEARFIKLNQINNEWIAVEAAGWDSGQGFSLGITPSDVALLVGVFSLAKEASSLGMELPKIISMSNTPVSFTTIWEMTELLLRYGEARASLSSTFAARRKAVQDATTIEEVNLA